MAVYECMLDLETMARKPDAAIVSIGAVKFDDDGIHDEFYINIDPRSCKEAGLRIDINTINWWKDQKPEAYAALKNFRVPLAEALRKFSEWFGPKSLEIWANAPTFDCVILRHAYEVLNLEPPWQYYDENCYRTMVKRFGISKIKASDRDLHHNALSDAKAQTMNLLSIFKK